MDGFMRLVDASKRALASPSRKAGTKDGDSSIESMGHIAATALPEDDVPTTAVQDTLGTIDPNIGKAGISDTNVGVASVVGTIDPNIGKAGVSDTNLGVASATVPKNDLSGLGSSLGTATWMS